MRRSGLKNWKEIIWYGWVVGGALVTANAIITHFLGHESIFELLRV